MPTAPVADRTSATSWPICDAAGWLALAAAPTFALMACNAAIDSSPIPLCAPVPGFLPINGMTAMYLLMSLFHLSPWLKLVSSRRPVRS